ncbi:hypothetical protein ASD64_07555 [Mesorhizobium sp. Root157]|uniref:DUF2628 domain-containing protein n=1 Tax=Mesorhizobium sp. Root157 TaxID=1736477 RepID=UPI0006FC03C9|nr:DUF2628 domain-containing protein [Mesorhizobium sp. Root157]KQZ82802.1 hypothetical protein ASD64_07555 [Mesorhizobium sp. Root157]
MASYVVMLPPRGNPEQRLEQAVFIRDGFSWLGFIVPPLWLLWHRLWLEAILAFLVMAFLSGLGEVTGFRVTGALLGLLVSLYVGLEDQVLRIAAMRRRGWQDWGVVEADRQDAADLRYALDVSQEATDAAPQVSIVPAATAMPRSPHAQDTLGLVSYPKRL